MFLACYLEYLIFFIDRSLGLVCGVEWGVSILVKGTALLLTLLLRMWPDAILYVREL